MKRIPFSSGGEEDALTVSRPLYGWRPGTIKKIKRQYNKRFRKQSKAFTKQCTLTNHSPS